MSDSISHDIRDEPDAQLLFSMAQYSTHDAYHAPNRAAEMVAPTVASLLVYGSSNANKSISREMIGEACSAKSMLNGIFTKEGPAEDGSETRGSFMSIRFGARRTSDQ